MGSGNVKAVDRELAIDSSSSDKTTKTVGGYTYTYYSYIQRWSPKLSARVHAIANKTVPIGYIGTRARMYRADGGLEGAADWTYNDDPLVGQDTYIYVEVDPDEYYYSKGQVCFYNGNGYTTYTTNASPNMSLGTSRYLPTVTTNEHGDIYGPEIFLEAIGIEPDLIYAIGVNGVEGYVKATDLEVPVAETPAEAVQQVRVNRTIPLYASDGISVIGSFVIQNNDPTAIAQ